MESLTQDLASEAQSQIDEWAIVELFGHQKMAGHVTEASIGGMLRIDVPDGKGGVLYTRIVNPKAIYAINPVSKEVAEAVASRFAEPPISRWELSDILPKPVAPALPAHDTEDEWDDELGF